MPQKHVRPAWGQAAGVCRGPGVGGNQKHGRWSRIRQCVGRGDSEKVRDEVETIGSLGDRRAVHDAGGRCVQRRRLEVGPDPGPSRSSRPRASGGPPGRSPSRSPRATRPAPTADAVTVATATSSTPRRSRRSWIGCRRSRPTAEPFRSSARPNRCRGPRVGATIDKPFGGAPKPKPKPTDNGPLRVLRYQPIGDVDIAPDLSVTFNQPMVPLTTLTQLDAADVPVKVTPALKGRWRWIGTRTLRFEFTGAVDRLPMATDYTRRGPGRHDVADRRKARAGGPLDVPHSAAEGADVRSGEHDRRHDAGLHRDVRPTRRSGRGDQAASRSTPAGRQDRDPRSHRRRDRRPRSGAPDRGRRADGRWVAFRPVAPLPNGATLTISIGPGTPSAEGPRTTTTASTHTATTYSALAVTDSQCGYGEGCRPGIRASPITFNNALDPKAFDSSTA